MSCSDCGTVTGGETALRYTRSGMCAGCPWQARDGPVVLCAVNGRLIDIGDADGCGRGIWPEAGGVVRWCGVRWHGVPWPLRWRLVRRGVMPRAGMALLPGCGCIVPLKSLWGWVLKCATWPGVALRETP